MTIPLGTESVSPSSSIVITIARAGKAHKFKYLTGIINMIKLNNVKIGIIGAAGQQGRLYIEKIGKMEQCKLVALCDLKSRMGELTNLNIKLFDNIDSFLSEDFDLAILATPSITHHDLAISCLNANKHVLVEKPIAINLQEVEEMIETSKKRDKKLMVSNVEYFNSVTQPVKDIIDGNYIGEVFGFRSIRFMSPTRERVRSPDAMVGTLNHDLINFLTWFGTNVKEVYAVQRKIYSGSPWRDFAYGIINFYNNIGGSFQVGWVSGKSNYFEAITEIYGKEGEIKVDYKRNKISVAKGNEIKEISFNGNGFNYKWNKLLESVVKAVLDEEEYPIPLNLLRYSLLVADKLVESSVKSKKMDITKM